MHTVCWIPKGTNTHWEYVILTAFPQQQRLHECASCYVICTLSAFVHFILLCSNSNLHFHYKSNISWVPCTSMWQTTPIHDLIHFHQACIFSVIILPSVSSKRNSDYKTNCLTVQLITPFIPHLTELTSQSSTNKIYLSLTVFIIAHPGLCNLKR